MPSCACGRFAQERLDRADAEAAGLGVTGTPTFAVARDGGPARRLDLNVQDPQAVARALDAELAR